MEIKRHGIVQKCDTNVKHHSCWYIKTVSLHKYWLITQTSLFMCYKKQVFVYLIQQLKANINCLLQILDARTYIERSSLGIISGNEQYLAHKRRQQKMNYLWPFLGMGGAMLSFCQWHVKMGQVFLPIGTRWWNNQIEAVNCSLSRTFKLFPHTVFPSFTSTASALPCLHPHILLCHVPGVSERLRRHIAASPVPAELWRGLGGDGINETCSPGATFLGSEGRRVVATWII